jgi:hypothetical protein
VGTRCSVKAGVRQNEARDGLSADDVGGDDFFYVIVGNVAVPDGVGIDDYGGSVFALVETSGLVGANRVAHIVLGENLLEFLLELGFGVRIATATGMVFVALVGADKDVLFKFGHGSRLQQRGI